MRLRRNVTDSHKPADRRERPDWHRTELGRGLYDGAMGSATRSTAPSQPRLLAIIELQNAIAAAAMNADEGMHIVAERAATLTTPTPAMAALVEGEDLVVRTVVGSAKVPMAGPRLRRSGSVAGRCVAERRA